MSRATRGAIGTQPALASLAALALAVGLGGCELTTVEVAVPGDLVVVEAYLRADAINQEVYLYRTVSGQGDVGDATQEVGRVDNARVRIFDEDGAQLAFIRAGAEAECAESSEGTCYVSQATQAFVRPGGTYRLEVMLEDGGTLTGRTTMPGQYRIVTPAPATCVLEGLSLPVVWTRSEGAWAYQIMALFSDLAEGLSERGVVDPPDVLSLMGLAVGGADTTIAFPGEFGVFDRFSVERDLLLALAEGLPNGSRADIVLAAGDRNYVNWLRGGNFNPSGQVRVPSVTGAGTGVFGSVVVHRRSLLAQDDGSGLPSCQ